MNKGDLCSKAQISKGVIVKMKNDELITSKVIEKICDIFQCDIGIPFN